MFANTVLCNGGDLCTKDGKKIEVKCFSSKGPISFGPTEDWDYLILIDATKYGYATFYIFNGSNKCKEWANINVNKIQTFKDQSLQGKRPRINFKSISTQVKLKYIGSYEIINMLKNPHLITKYKMSDSIKIADFFAGVGGIRLGFEKASKQFKCVFSNEINKYAIQTYEHNFPGCSVNNSSITDLDIQVIPDFDLFIGGFPCQPFSIAGHRKGFEDHRGNVFIDIARIIEAKKPKAILLENVKNLSGHDNGNTLKVIGKTLVDLGYTLKYTVLNSCKHGNVPQNRERIFIIGFLDESTADKFHFPLECKLTKSVFDFIQQDIPKKYYYNDSTNIYQMLVEEVTDHINTNQVYQFRRQYVRANKSGVCPTLTANMGGGGHNVPIIKDDVGIRKITPRECFSIQGFPNEFKIPPSLSDTQLYKQAGNSVTVPLISKIAKNMLFAMKGKIINGDPGTIVNKNSVKGYPGLEDVYGERRPVITTPKEESNWTFEYLNKKNCNELRKICAELGVKGRSKMRKKKLITTILFAK